MFLRSLFTAQSAVVVVPLKFIFQNVVNDYGSRDTLPHRLIQCTVLAQSRRSTFTPALTRQTEVVVGEESGTMVQKHHNQ